MHAVDVAHDTPVSTADALLGVGTGWIDQLAAAAGSTPKPAPSDDISVATNTVQ
jgi:hypothetical protein